MADITMCKGHGCPLAKQCYRHNATPSGFTQSWAMFDEAPKDERGECSYFWRDPALSTPATDF
jgi:hypothetical protein